MKKIKKSIISNSIIGICAGFITGFFSTGGGMIVLPAIIHIMKLDEKKERTYLVLTNKAIELSNCQKEKMIEAYEKIISNIQEDDLAVTWCTLRKIRQLMEEI